MDFFDGEEEAAESDFVPFGADEVLDFVEWDLEACLLDDGSCLGDFYAEEAVAFAVVSFACLEESAEDVALAVVAHGEEGGGDVAGCNHCR